MKTYFIESGKLANIENSVLNTNKNISLIVSSYNRVMIENQIKNHIRCNVHYNRKTKLQVIRCDDGNNVLSVKYYK